MHRKFEDEFNALRDDLLYMASLVENELQRAVDALRLRNIKIAESVIEKDAEINNYEVRIENTVIELLAKHTPVASDLRFLASTLKINNDLERIADHAVNIAQRTLQILDEPELKPLIDIPRMAAIAQSMMKDAIDAFIHNDADRALDVCRRDDEVDSLNDQVIRELLTYMISDSRAISRALSLIFVAKNLERVADLSTNIAEEVVFIVEARSIKHHGDGKEAAEGGNAGGE